MNSTSEAEFLSWWTTERNNSVWNIYYVCSFVDPLKIILENIFSLPFPSFSAWEQFFAASTSRAFYTGLSLWWHVGFDNCICERKRSVARTRRKLSSAMSRQILHKSFMFAATLSISRLGKDSKFNGTLKLIRSWQIYFLMNKSFTNHNPRLQHSFYIFMLNQKPVSSGDYHI